MAAAAASGERCPACGGERRVRVVRVRPAVVAGLYGIGLGLAWWLTGDLLHDLAEGLDRSRLPLWKLAVPAAVLAAAAASVFGRRRPVCPRCDVGRVLVAGAAPPPARRRVLRALGIGGAMAASGGVGAVVAVARNRGWLPVAADFFGATVETTSPSPRPEWAEARVRSYRRLGRTDAWVSDISFGSGRIDDAGVAIRAIERGVTYFDTAPDYAEAGSEQLLGRAFKGRRDGLFIATKFCRPEGHLLDETPVPEIMAAVEASLRRLQTDHVDLIHIHSCDRVERLLAPNIHEAFDRLKAQGKVRFLGVSTHTPNLEAVANAAIDSGRFDVLMLAYHFGMWRSFAQVLEKARRRDVGVVAMKTLKGARHANLAEFRREGAAYSQAAFRWVLSNPNVSCLVVSFSKLQHCDEYLAASGTVPRPGDVALLERYDALTAGDYCQPHCGACLASCPAELPIHDILRYRMYFRDYGWEKEGMRRYAALARDPSACVGCPAPCAGSCPLGVPIRAALLDARRLLSFRS